MAIQSPTSNFNTTFIPVIILEKHIVPEIAESVRLVDYAIGIFPQIATKNAVKKAIKRKSLMVNDEIATTGKWMTSGDTIAFVENGFQIPKQYILSEEIEIIYEDNYLAIVQKPSGLVVSGNQFKTLENALVGKLKISTEIDALKWSKPVHRLDAATSGLVLFAKTASTHTLLAKMFENRTINKRYYAIVTGELKGDLILNEPINELVAITEIKVLKTINSLRNEFVTLVELSPKTGRTHQLRIHCSNAGHPIVGDNLYGIEGRTLLHKGLFLAAVGLKFNHPITNEVIDIRTDLPYKFTSFLEREEKRWRKFKLE